MDVSFVYFSSGLNGWEAACNSVHVTNLWAHWAANDIVKCVDYIKQMCTIKALHFPVFLCFPAASTLDVMYSIIGPYNMKTKYNVMQKKKKEACK